MQLAAAQFERDGRTVDLERPAVEADAGVEAGFAVAVQQRRAVARRDAVEVGVLGQRVVFERQSVLGVVHLDGLHRRHARRLPAFRHVARDRTRSAVTLYVLNARFRTFGHDELLAVPQLIDEGAVVVLHALFEFIERRIDIRVEVVILLAAVLAGLLRERDRRLGCIHRQLPFLPVVGGVHQRRTVGIVESHVIGIAVDQRRGGVEQQARLVAERRHLRRHTQFGRHDRLGQQSGRLVVAVGDELHAIVVGRAGYENLLFGRIDRNEFLHHDDRPVVFEQTLVVVADQEPRLTGITVGVLGRDDRHFINVVEHVVAVADTPVDVVVGTAAHAARLPAAEIGVARRLLVVEEALARKVVGRAARTRYEIVAGELVGRPVVADQIGHVGLQVVAELVGLLGRFPDVLLGRLAFGHDVEVVARAAQQ